MTMTTAERCRAQMRSMELELWKAAHDLGAQSAIIAAQEKTIERLESELRARDLRITGLRTALEAK